MKSAHVTGPSNISVSESEAPVPGRGELLVRMHACGICGSDIEKVFGAYGKSSMRLGHEPAGTVTGTGDGVQGFGIGDRVFTHHHVPCHSCHLCEHGNETLCPTYSETNLSPCGLSQQYVVPAWNVAHGGVLRLPDNVSFEEAAMIEPLACCVRAWRRLEPRHHRRGDTVAVLGTGPTGVMHVMLALAKKSSRVFCLDPNDFRLDFAAGLGDAVTTLRSDDPGRKKDVMGQTQGRGVDAAIVATGSMSALADATELVRRGGAVMMFGVPSKGATMEVDMGMIYDREISLYTSYAASDDDTVQALDLIASSQINVRDLVTHTYPIADSQKAFEHAKTGDGAMKIVITG